MVSTSTHHHEAFAKEVELLLDGVRENEFRIQINVFQSIAVCERNILPSCK